MGCVFGYVMAIVVVTAVSKCAAAIKDLSARVSKLEDRADTSKD